MKNFPKDLRVASGAADEGMKGDQYQRPAFQATSDRLHGKGRLLSPPPGIATTSGLTLSCSKSCSAVSAWAMGNVNADVTPNIEKVTPQANQLKL